VNLSGGSLRVAVVAPSLAILGGQSVQADRLLQLWRDDPAVDAWLVPHNPLPPRPLRWMTRIKYLRTLITEAVYVPLLVKELRHADVVHVFSASYTSFLLAPLPAVLISRALRKPVVLNYHSGEAPDHLARSTVARRILRGVNRNAVPSVFLRDVFARFGIDAAVVPNLVALDGLRYRPRVPLRPRLLSTRNMEPIYNVECTLRAFQAVQAQCSEASLTLVGSGSELPRLKALASSLGLRNVVFAGRVAPAAIADYYASHDIYIQSPTIDNMPLSVLEAYASGLPVVSTDVGGIPAILTHREHGLLAPSDDAAMLAAHVLHLLADADHARTLAEKANSTLEDYAWPLVRQRWLAVYDSIRPGRVPQTAAVQT